MDASQEESEDAITDALQAWRQGDFALAVGPYIHGDLPAEDSQEKIDPVYDDACEGFVVVSQTCEVVRRPSDAQFVTVSPLVKVTAQTVKMIEAGRVPTLALIANAPENHVADLSRMMTVDKALFATWKRQSGLNTPEEIRDFAFALERKHGRFAFPEAFNQSMSILPKKIHRTYGKAGSELGAALRSLQEIRVLPSPDWDADSVEISFIFIMREEAQRECSPDAIGEQLSRLTDAIEWQIPFLAAQDGFLRVCTYRDMTAQEYLESSPLDLNALSFAAKFSQN